MRAKSLGGEKSVFKTAFEKLLDLISEAEIRYDTRLYIDSEYMNTRSWLNVAVFIHGDRNIVNIISIKLITWQHQNLKAWENCYLYVYPAEDREKYEKTNT